jgi:N-acetylglucosaminyldiphosphoundecaprenol N-acetyl-beta-D-mannosaminyltransferase
MSTMQHETTENILGYPITTLGKEDCVGVIIEWIVSGQTCKYLVCANPHSLELANRDLDFRNAILNADLVTPDGVGITIASKILRGRIDSRVTGSDIFQGISCALNEMRGYSYFFLGSTEENLSLIQSRVRQDFPNIKIAGTFSPPFKDDFTVDENLTMLQAINRAQPDVLWVGMTAPKQEKWIHQNKSNLNANFIGAIGAVFDFYVGTVKRSSPWFLDHGMEWLPRLLREPGRLWYPNFVSGPTYLMRVIMHHYSKGRKRLFIGGDQ